LANFFYKSSKYQKMGCFRWQKGPDNVDPKDGSHITMVTAEHMNQLLKLVLKLIMKHIGDESAEWMTKIAVYAQQIIINTSGMWFIRL
jgi:ryanodine receptor 2